MTYLIVAIDSKSLITKLHQKTKVTKLFYLAKYAIRWWSRNVKEIMRRVGIAIRTTFKNNFECTSHETFICVCKAQKVEWTSADSDLVLEIKFFSLMRFSIPKYLRRRYEYMSIWDNWAKKVTHARAYYSALCYFTSLPQNPYRFMGSFVFHPLKREGGR